MDIDEVRELDLVEDEKQDSKSYSTTLVFHCLFKGLALFMYLFNGLFGVNFVISFVLIVLFNAFDFWTVKNVSGRLIVGLRWWNEVDEDGENQWYFEKAPEGKTVNAYEARIFWLTLILTPVLWVMLCISVLLTGKFQWVVLCCVAIALSGTNLWGYYRCRYGSNASKAQLAKYAVGIMTSV